MQFRIESERKIIGLKTLNSNGPDHRITNFHSRSQVLMNIRTCNSVSKTKSEIIFPTDQRQSFTFLQLQ